MERRMRPHSFRALRTSMCQSPGCSEPQALSLCITALICTALTTSQYCPIQCSPAMLLPLPRPHDSADAMTMSRDTTPLWLML